MPEWQRIAGKAAKEVEKFAKEKADLVLMHWRDKMGITQKEVRRIVLVGLWLNLGALEQQLHMGWGGGHYLVVFSAPNNNRSVVSTPPLCCQICSRTEIIW